MWVESMSKAISLKSLRRSGGVKSWTDRPGEISVAIDMVRLCVLIKK